ncbi:transporter substrate-binding domain-containing protein [Dongshaea marina]|uniref:transporter substrate-binding domain-containing protein n=1 Tax=Dongshaea marina TaxID=2047966 RepID=UPI000D3EACAC|nr:transporter substrate-binding domain-containing protein [Dongshaea marina]
MKKLICAALFGLISTQVVAKQVIKFEMEATYAPFEYVNKNNEIKGFDVDLANALCQELNAQCSFHNVPFDSLIPALKFHRYDAAISAIDITEARSKQVSFTQPYYENAAAFVTLSDNLKSQQSLKDKRVGVQNGTTHQRYLLEQMPGVTAVPYASYLDAFNDLKTGRIDAIFSDTAILADWVKKDSKLHYIGKPVTNPSYFGNGFGIAVNKSNTKLLAQLNQALSTIKENGQYQIIYNKYFGS